MYQDIVSPSEWILENGLRAVSFINNTFLTELKHGYFKKSIRFEILIEKKTINLGTH